MRSKWCAYKWWTAYNKNTLNSLTLIILLINHFISQDFADNNIYLNYENTSDKIFHCNICGKSFELNHLLNNHLAEHKRQINYKTNKCTFCGKKFKLKIALNKHNEKYHKQQQINIQQSSILGQ